MKFCPTCKTGKPLTAFRRNAARPDGLQSQCKDCKKEVQERWYAKNRVQHRHKANLWREQRIQENREKVLGYLTTHPCVDCGEDDPVVLEFDHVRGEKTAAITNMVLQSAAPWEQIECEISKCEVRCANCHRRKTARDGGFFRHRARSSTVRAPG